MKIKAVSSEVVPKSIKKVSPGKARKLKVIEKSVKEAKDEFQRTSPHKQRGLHKGIFAFGSAVENFTRILGNTGKFFVITNALIGGIPGGLTAIMGIMGGTLSIVDGAKEAKYSAVNRSVSGGITGSLEIVGGIGILASAIGFGPIPALVGLTAYGAKLGYQLYNMFKRAKKFGKPKLKAQPATSF